MPQPPQVDLITRYLFENPWPLAVILICIAAALAWNGAREGLAGRVKLGGVFGLAGAAVIAAAALVTTSGEQGERVVRAFVEAAVANDLTGARRMLTADATLAIGSPNNPGIEVNAILRQLERLRQYQITSNRITQLRGYGTAGDRAVVHLSCRTETGRDMYGSTPSQWVMEVRREPDGDWLIVRITCISIAGQTPSLNLW